MLNKYAEYKAQYKELIKEAAKGLPTKEVWKNLYSKFRKQKRGFDKTLLSDYPKYRESELGILGDMANLAGKPLDSLENFISSARFPGRDRLISSPGFNSAFDEKLYKMVNHLGGNKSDEIDKLIDLVKQRTLRKANSSAKNQFNSLKEKSADQLKTILGMVREAEKVHNNTLGELGNTKQIRNLLAGTTALGAAGTAYGLLKD